MIEFTVPLVAPSAPRIAETYAGNERYSEQTVNIGNRGGAGLAASSYYTYNGIDYEFNSSIASVRVYDRALTKAEIQQNFNSTRNRFGV